MKYITLEAVNKKIPLNMYIQGIKFAKNNLEREFKHGLTCWYPCTGRDIIRQFLQGVHDRINQRISYNKRGINQKGRE